MSTTPITRADLEDRLRGVQHAVQGTVHDRKQSLKQAATVGAVVLMVLFFLLGRRSGKKKTTFVEIRRL